MECMRQTKWKTEKRGNEQQPHENTPSDVSSSSSKVGLREMKAGRKRRGIHEARGVGGDLGKFLV